MALSFVAFIGSCYGGGRVGGIGLLMLLRDKGDCFCTGKPSLCYEGGM